VISLHGGGMWPAAQRETSQWNRVADEHGFIVVYPSGKGPLARQRAWRAAGGAGSEKDTRFISDLIDTLKATYNIDLTRVYANGLSNGGGMSFVLSCMLSDRIAAIGLVASAQFLPWSSCTDRRPVPMISFHGTADRQTWYKGGTSWVAPKAVFPDIEAWTANWARRNQCGQNPIQSMVAKDVSRREYTNCAEDAPVVLYTILGGGHTWPGGGLLPEWFVGATSHSIDASSQMWAFFREHALPGK
jgi:polyhydroxybutyrate depolymerase